MRRNGARPLVFHLRGFDASASAHGQAFATVLVKTPHADLSARRPLRDFRYPHDLRWLCSCVVGPGMTTTVTTWSGAAALAAFVGASAGCSLLIGNEDRTYLAPDAAAEFADAANDDAAAPNDGSAPLTDGAIVPPRDAAGGDSAMTSKDAAPPPPVDASPPPPDASPPPPTCPPPGAPSGTACCGSIACLGEACQHCNDCRVSACATGEYCCAQFNGGGHYKGTSCSATPCANGGGGN